MFTYFIIKTSKQNVKNKKENTTAFWGKTKLSKKNNLQEMSSSSTILYSGSFN